MGNPIVDMANPDSYYPLMVKWLDIIKPKRILEWGPGLSTQVMRERCPKANIISIEHQKKYYDIAMDQLRGLNIQLFLIEENENSSMPNYTNPPVFGFFDFIFVDGRHRVDCLKTSMKLIKKNGIIMLHDAERLEYQRGINLFKKVDEGDGTVCLRHV